MSATMCPDIDRQAHVLARKTVAGCHLAALEVLDGLERNGAFCSTTGEVRRGQEGPFTGGDANKAEHLSPKEASRADRGTDRRKVLRFTSGRLKTTAIWLTICGSVLSGSVVERVSRVSTPANNGAPDRQGRLPRSAICVTCAARQCHRGAEGPRPGGSGSL